MIKKFEDILAWQKSQDLAIEIYTSFSGIKDYGFKDQICRAVVSISNNIAEGYDRFSQPEFRKFLSYSTGSCSEVRSMLYLAKRLRYIDNTEFKKLCNQSIETTKILRGLVKTVSSKIKN